VMVNKLTKYAHFLALSHPFTTCQMAQVYLENVFKLHGLPTIMVSDWDPIFTSRLWQELFRLTGILRQMVRQRG
jgi:hypothetical protein